LADREGVRCASHVSLSSNLDEPFDLREEQGNHLVMMIDFVDHTALIFRLDGWSAVIVRSSPSRRNEVVHAMVLTVDLRHPVPEPGASLEPSPGREIARVVDGEVSPVGPGTSWYSFWADCECPDDCLRDHENE
jgi:hypothetical protein